MNAASLTKTRWLLAMLAAVVVSRIPLLIGGYGADPDSWRIAFVARKIWDSGTYEVSRFPGYPLHELVSVLPIVLGGSLISNIATLLCSLAAIVVWTDIANTHARYPRLLIIAFAFTPIFWITSATTMDYAWSLLFIIMSYREALKGYPIRSGLLFGVALGFRLSNVVAIAAMIAVLFQRGYRWQDLTRFTAAAGLATVTSFLPVFLTYGIPNWLADIHQQVGGMSETATMHILLFGYRTVYTFGPTAILAAGIMLMHKRQNVRSLLGRGDDAVFVSSLWGVCALLVSFLVLPLERAYLLPAVPFLLLIMDAIASRKEMIVLMLCLVSFAFVNPDVIHHKGIHGSPGFHLRPGIVMHEYAQKRAIIERRMFLSSHKFPDHTVVMTGVGPVFWVENSLVEPLQGQTVDDIRDVIVKSRTQNNILFTPMLKQVELDSLQSLGFAVVCTADLHEYIETSVGYSMKSRGIRLLEVPDF